jgi:1-pyrroline-5-carboxylate dehydrogenase
MIDAITEVPTPENEPVKDYVPGSADREALDAACEAIAGETLEIPALVDGKAVKGEKTSKVSMPHDHGHVLAEVHHANAGTVQRAIDGAMKAAPAWQAMSYDDRAAIFLRAAEMLAGPWRMRINAACMLGQSKTAHQAEIDSACELIDFLRFNVCFGRQLHRIQPRSAGVSWNRTDYRPLEGFVLAVTPFNFLAIAVNLPTAPALMGNVVLWKPAMTSMVGAWHMLELLREAGLPDGVIQLIPGDGPTQGEACLASEHLAGIHFTGSTGTFKTLWKGVADNLDGYRAFPRIVGETGGKDFIVAHPSADAAQLATAIVRGGYEFQGQKCSAASRLYLPKSLWGEVRDRVCAELEHVLVGDVRDPKNFLGAVIDEKAYEKITGYQKLAQESASVVHGGTADRSKGWFIDPTLVQVDDPKHRLMQEEIFGPVVTAYVYEDDAFDEALDLVDSTGPYALTGAIFARDRAAVAVARDRLRQAAGNFYVNDKPTGAVVSQQPFGGARGSGTNDKAGSPWNLLRWMSPRSIKETLVPPTDWRYPFLAR